MSDPISAVVKVASSPDQAKLFVATLKAAGIPAFTDGSLPDEFSMSQQLMNLAGTKVMVPRAALELAQEELARFGDETEAIDLEELTRQALEAESPEQQSPEG